MASERDENDPLFKKLTEPSEIFKLIESHEDSPMGRVLDAYDLPSYGRMLDRGASEPKFIEKAWVWREALRCKVLWARAREFSHVDLATRCEVKTAPFYRWALAPAYGDVTKIRYTPSEEYGRADRQVVTTLGRFLQKHYPGLGQEEIREWQNQWTRCTKQLELLFASTPDEVEYVYRNGPHSCMAHGLDAYQSDEHPSRLWGYCKDTRVAYTKNAKDEIVARCLVRDDTKEWIRIYPNSAPAFEAALAVAGYRPGSCEGLLVPAICSGGGYLMPYCDGASYGTHVQGDMIRLGGHGDFDVQCTEGVADVKEEDDNWCCPRCDEYHDNDNAMNRATDGTVYCDSCADDFVTAINASDGHSVVHRDYADWVEAIDEWVVCDPLAYEAAGLVWVESNSAYEIKAECVQTHNGDWEPRHYCVELDDGRWALEDDTVEDAAGARILRSEARQLLDGTWEAHPNPNPNPASLEMAGQMVLPVPVREWTEDDDRLLLMKFDLGENLDALARHFRTNEANVIERLRKYGRMALADQYIAAA